MAPLRDAYPEEQELRGRAYSGYNQPYAMGHRSSSFDPTYSAGAYGPQPVGVPPAANYAGAYEDPRYQQSVYPSDEGRGRTGFLGSFFSSSSPRNEGQFLAAPSTYSHHRAHSLEPSNRPAVMTTRALSPNERYPRERRYSDRRDETITRKIARAIVEDKEVREEERARRYGMGKGMVNGMGGGMMGAPTYVEPVRGRSMGPPMAVPPPSSFGSFSRFQSQDGVYRYRSPGGRVWEHVESPQGVPYMRHIDAYGKKQYVQLRRRSPSRGYNEVAIPGAERGRRYY